MSNAIGSSRESNPSCRICHLRAVPLGHVADMEKVGLKIEEAADQTRWREGVRAIAEGMRCIRPPSVTRKKPNQNWIDDDDDGTQLSGPQRYFFITHDPSFLSINLHAKSSEEQKKIPMFADFATANW